MTNHYRKIPLGLTRFSKREAVNEHRDKQVLAEVGLGGKRIYWPAILRYDPIKPNEFYLEDSTGHKTAHEVKSLLGLLVSIP